MYYYFIELEADRFDTTLEGGADNTSCGANSVMLRDSVCDEETNTAVCLFDGGDCCLELKVKDFCKNCSCNLVVKSAKLLELFVNTDFKPLKNPERITEEAKVVRWIIEVDDVVSGAVCAMLCLEHDEKRSYINAWHYDKIQQVCHCGWIDSSPCPEHLIIPDWQLTGVADLACHNSYLQMKKTVPCGM